MASIAGAHTATNSRWLKPALSLQNAADRTITHRPTQTISYCCSNYAIFSKGLVIIRLLLSFYGLNQFVRAYSHHQFAEVLPF
ncbi:hypothetical protein CLV44_10458 [Marinobacterium halophilum]|uniref:Uncharacterized protein n=1 Tax=Marinobacterium halophilum TaxID=267374 RepID=A0A2P8F156_9GAMM|nr:hypothetical protein CLV44_10458 [Marinobacterium halophilum]